MSLTDCKYNNFTVPYSRRTYLLITNLYLQGILLPGIDQYLFVRIRQEDRSSSHAFITGVLNGINPDYPVDIKYHNQFSVSY